MISLFNKKVILGTFAYWLGSEIIAQSCVYEGETERDAYFRARESLQMLNRDKLCYLYHAKAKFYPLGK